MILDLSKTKIFTKDPDHRFSLEYAVPHGTWKELWRRYKLLDYSNGDLRDYLFVKHARNLSYTSMDRWIMRSEIYTISSQKLKLGAKHVTSDVFGEYEQYIIDELTKNLKHGVSTNSRTII